MTPWGGANFDHRVIILTTFVEVVDINQTMSHAKYQSTSPCGFGEEEFLSFHYMYKENQF